VVRALSSSHFCVSVCGLLVCDVGCYPSFCSGSFEHILIITWSVGSVTESWHMPSFLSWVTEWCLFWCCLLVTYKVHQTCKCLILGAEKSFWLVTHELRYNLSIICCEKCTYWENVVFKSLLRTGTMQTGSEVQTTGSNCIFNIAVAEANMKSRLIYASSCTQ